VPFLISFKSRRGELNWNSDRRDVIENQSAVCIFREKGERKVCLSDGGGWKKAAIGLLKGNKTPFLVPLVLCGNIPLGSTHHEHGTDQECALGRKEMKELSYFIPDSFFTFRRAPSLLSSSDN
jgi:hypothetical protein